MRPLTLHLVQNSAGPVITENLASLSALLDNTPPVDLIALPEVFSARGTEADYRQMAQPLDGQVGSWAAALARQRNAWVLAGSIIEKAGTKIFNTCVIFNRTGRIASTYRKIHLFEAHLDDGRHIRESESYDPGDTPVTVDIEGWKAGLSICYDLRFPELFRHYSKAGAHLLFVPSNFTQRTGQDHWEVLLRARAIENQCFVVAPGQCGVNAAINVVSYGNSMAVGPWGEVLCRAGDRESVLTATLEPALLTATRERVPALKHRRL